MHLKCPSGQTRWKHGLHSTFSEMTFAFADSGGVNAGELEP